jgi:hypothetical protein
MYDVTRIKTAFQGLVGHRQPSDPDIPQISSLLTASDTGLYFQDSYPFLSIETMDACLDNFDTLAFATYSAIGAYVIGDKVLYNSRAYVSLSGTVGTPNTGNTPSATSAYWRLQFEQELLNITNQAALTVIEEWLTVKKMNNSIKALYDSVMIFDGAGRIPNTIIREGRFVGFRLTPQRQAGIAVRLNFVGFQFTQNQNFNLYIFHSSKSTPLYTIPVVTTAGANNFQWISVDKLLPYYNLDQTTVANQTDSGCYFVGYFEDDITGQAVNKDYDFSKVPCLTCNKDMHNVWSQNLYNKYAKVEPITVNASDLSGTSMFDIEKVGFVWNSNFGMNLKIDVCCDITDFLITEKRRFKMALLKQVVIRMANQVLYTNRQNAITEQQRRQVLLDLKGIAESNFFGIESEYKRELEMIDMDFSDFDSPCFKKKNAGIKAGSI